MIRNPTMFYYNVMMPPGVPFAYPPMLKATKRRKKKKPFQLHTMHPYKRKRFSLTYYLKYVLWRKIRRYWKRKKTKKTNNKSKKKDVTVVRPSGASVLTSNRGSSEKIGTRDFWGSKYGSQWLFAKEDIARRGGGDHNRLVEIVDAFKTSDLKYAQRRKGDDATATPRRHRRHKCGCSSSRRSDAGSEWSLSTPRPYSKWPPSCGGHQEQLASLLSRQHAYVYNWLYVDQLQGRLPLSRDCFDQVRRRLQELQQQRQQLVGQLEQRRRKRRSSSCASSSSEWGSTLSRRERAKLLKRQVRAKERASVLWLLSKAFDGEIPPDVLEPFYRDKDNVRRLKPKIVHSLANAELYCLALTNIYSDPNYNNLDHHGIVQFLTRKGIPLPESRELPLTETTLVQTAPIRMNAHMAVIGGIMSLYVKEVLIPEKIVEVVGRFSHVDLHNEMPFNAEEAAILWINKCCRALENDIKAECPLEHESRLPKIPVLNNISDVSDGCCIAAVISFYCPNFFRWQDICWNNPISLGDSIHNLQLVKKFCSDFLPREVNFLTMEDLLYLHPSIKDNVLAFIADLLFMFVIRAACVTPRKKTVHHDTSHIPLESSKSLSSFQSHKTQAVCSPIPNLRSDSYGGSTSSLPDITRPGSRARNCGSKERLCEKVLIKKSNFPSDEVGLNELQRTSSVSMVNGWKTNLPHVGSTDSVSSSSRHPDLSRLPAEGESASSQSQPSIYSADDSGLPKSIGHGSRTTLCSQSSPPRENKGFGLRKSSDIMLGYRASGDGHTSNEQRRSRKSLEDYYSHLAGADGPMRSISASNITDNHRKKDFGESVPESASSQSSGICLSDVDIKNAFSTTSFAQLSKSREPHGGNSINITYMPQESLEKKSKRPEGGKKTTFAALPNTTTWQQVHSGHPQTDSGHETPTEPVDGHLNAQLCNIRMKLEDKKRKIELKKKRMEMLWKKQRQKLGKAAFLQAVSKGAGTPDSGNGEPPEIAAPTMASPSMVKRMSMQEIAADLDSVQKKWLHQGEEPVAAPETDHNSPEFSVEVDGEAVNLDFVTSIEHLNTSLTDLQADISRISLQQEQVENLMKDSIDDGSHFFLHGAGMSDHTFEALSLRPEVCCYESPALRSKQGGFSAASPNRPKAIYHQALDHSTPYASLPPASINKEDLYSKVIKPDRGQKQQAKLASSPPNRPGDSLAAISNIDHQKKPAKPKAAAEIHVVLPQVPDHKPSVFSNASKKAASDETQGFYIPIEKGGRKVKPKVQQKSSANNKVVGGGDVPNSLKNVPSSSQLEDVNSLGFVIGADLVHPDPETETEMARRKEMIMNLSIQRKAEYELKRIQKEKEYERIKEEERRKQEYHEHKREEEKRRREAILEQYRQRKLAEELEKEKSAMPKEIIGKFTKPRSSIPPVQRRENRLSLAFTKPTVELRNNINSSRQQRKELKPRPKSAYVHMNSDLSSLLSMDSTANKRNSHIFPGRDMHEFDLDSLNSASTSASSHDRHKSPNGFHPSHRNSLQIPEGSGPSSDGASDTASNGSSAAAADYTGPKLFVKPAAKSNRGIIINAINTVLAGAVNADTKKKVLEEINRSDSKHFLILFRDAGCQFRAMYTYNPEREEVTKLFGIGPKNVVDKMMERFYKYNSGGKCFSEIQTKHLTVTIDAFTIPNSLWAGKKVIPPKKEYF